MNIEGVKENKWQVGSFWEAIKEAEELSIDDSIYAVWDKSGDLEAIIYQGEVFEK